MTNWMNSNILIFLVLIFATNAWALPEMSINKIGTIGSIDKDGSIVAHEIEMQLTTGEKEVEVGDDFRTEPFVKGHIIVEGVKFDRPKQMISTLPAINFSEDVGDDEYELVVLVGRPMVKRWLKTIDEQRLKNPDLAQEIEQMKGDCQKNQDLFVALTKNRVAIFGNCPSF